MGKFSKDKGKRGELEWAHFCQKHGFEDCRRTAQNCGKSGDASDVIGLPFMHQEVKRVEALNVYNAITQAVDDSKNNDNIPMVAHRKNGKKWLVTMHAEDWFKLYKAFKEMMDNEQLTGRFFEELQGPSGQQQQDSE